MNFENAALDCCRRRHLLSRNQALTYFVTLNWRARVSRNLTLYNFVTNSDCVLASNMR